MKFHKRVEKKTFSLKKYMLDLLETFNVHTMLKLNSNIYFSFEAHFIIQ